jgi:hypothetical protein
VAVTRFLQQQATWNRKQETTSEQQRFDIFDVVYHFSEAADLIRDPEQRLVIARLNLMATVKGKNSMGASPCRPLASRAVCVNDDGLVPWSWQT